MSPPPAIAAEPQFLATEPFDAVAATYDPTFTETAVGSAQRAQVALDLERRFHPGEHLLELNCGTGHDALALARRGIRVTAFDASPAMISVASEKLAASPELSNPQFGVLRNEDLRFISGCFDGAFSNFAGLNCSRDWSDIASELQRLIKPGGHLLLCIMGRTCLWEIITSFLSYKPRRAIRRFFRFTTASIGGTPIEIYYPSVGEARKVLGNGFRLQSWRGIGAFVPPSYLNSVVQDRPRLLRLLQHLDMRLSGLPIIRNLADHVLLHFVRTGL